MYELDDRKNSMQSYLLIHNLTELCQLDLCMSTLGGQRQQ